MRTSDVLLGGLAGAGLLTATHETLRRTVPRAPRMDLLGMQALRRLIAGAKGRQPGSDRLFLYTMAGDLLANALYYSIAGIHARNVVLRSTLLGLAAGAGAVWLPEQMGLNPRPSSRTAETRLMTVALYTLGGLAAGLVLKILQKRHEPRHPGQQLVL
ncbi:hypothetical protein [Flaviaesturariibacter terrae]